MVRARWGGLGEWLGTQRRALGLEASLKSQQRKPRHGRTQVPLHRLGRWGGGGEGKALDRWAHRQLCLTLITSYTLLGYIKNSEERMQC